MKRAITFLLRASLTALFTFTCVESVSAQSLAQHNGKALKAEQGGFKLLGVGRGFPSHQVQSGSDYHWIDALEQVTGTRLYENPDATRFHEMLRLR